MTIMEATKKHIDKEIQRNLQTVKTGPQKGTGKFTVTYKAKVEKEALEALKMKIEEFEELLA